MTPAGGSIRPQGVRVEYPLSTPGPAELDLYLRPEKPPLDGGGFLVGQTGPVTKRYVSRNDVAERIGVKPDTLDRYFLPAPDALICSVRGWLAGAHVKVVQKLPGHKTAVLTLDRYGHLFPDDLDAVASALNTAAQAIADELRTIATSSAREGGRKTLLNWVAGAGFEPA